MRTSANLERNKRTDPVANKVEAQEKLQVTSIVESRGGPVH